MHASSKTFAVPDINTKSLYNLNMMMNDALSKIQKETKESCIERKKRGA